MTILISIWSPKIHKSGFFVLNLGLFVFFAKFWKLTKLRMLILNMTIGFLHFLPKITKTRHFLSKIPNKVFLRSNLGIFVFQQNSAITQIRETWFKIRQKFFNILVPNYPMKGFLIPNLGIFVLLQNLLQLDKFGGADFKHDNISLKLLPKNIQIRHLCFQI